MEPVSFRKVSENRASKTKVLLEGILDFGGLLNCDKIWNSLAKKEANKWKEAVITIPKDSDTEERFVYYRQVKQTPLVEPYPQILLKK